MEFKIKKKSHLFRVVEFSDQTTTMEQANTREGNWFFGQLRGGITIFYNSCVSQTGHKCTM